MTNSINVPNIISSCRIVAAPVMIYYIAAGNLHLFTWVLFGALLSDIADGLIARIFHLQTKLGAILDATGDMGMYLSAIIGLFVFKFSFITEHWIEIAIILGFYVVEKIKSYIAYKKPFNAFHTYLSKATAYAQGIFIMSLFFWGYSAIFFYISMAICIIANIEEMILTSLLKNYENDVKGLYWVLKRKKV
jgi:phosphatidylglycerophosphate synthase